MNCRVLAVGLVLLVSSPPTVAAQSLADVARQEDARRKAIAHPAKVLTNDDLKRVFSTLAPSIPQQAPAPANGTPAPNAAGQPADPAVASPTAKAQAEDPVQQQEQTWRRRITDARSALARTKVLIAAMQSRINALWADFTARDDPAQRAVIARDRQTALAELARLEQELKDQTKAIADIEDEARQAGVPPGWLR